jgi:ligand-binding sensor domain-containing protein
MFFSFLLIHWETVAQENSFVFSQLKEKDGLSDNTVNCFLKDSQGIVWIGTYNGLNRFDGSHFSFIKKRGTNSIINEVVHSLCEDKKEIYGVRLITEFFVISSLMTGLLIMLLKAMTPGVIFLIFVAISKDRSGRQVIALCLNLIIAVTSLTKCLI